MVRLLIKYVVVSRCASGLYKVRNLFTNKLAILPVDNLILTNLNEGTRRKIEERKSREEDRDVKRVIN